MFAELMREEYNKSIPTLLDYNEWHLPYITSEEKETLSLEECQKISVARCARVSYLNHDGNQTSKNKDFELYDRLVGGKIKHSSPCEHQAKPVKGWTSEEGVTHLSKDGDNWFGNTNKQIWSGNFRGWIQYRQLI